uniref:Uncharacterized protein n=1 Tax=Mycena chlorophos TaxID=658473 RepID=A0ABQ0L2N8_MYCCL|nr:predicted protein [Mycena chlorophos]
MKGLRGQNDTPTQKPAAAETPKPGLASTSKVNALAPHLAAMPPTNVVSIAPPHLRTLTADQEAELVANGLGPVPTLASASVAHPSMSATPIDDNPCSPLAIDTTTPDPLPLAAATPRDVMTPTSPVPATSASMKTPDVAMVESDDSEDEKENKLPLKCTASKVDLDLEDDGSVKKARKTKRCKARQSTGRISNDDIYAHMVKESERREEQFKAMMQCCGKYQSVVGRMQCY